MKTTLLIIIASLGLMYATATAIAEAYAPLIKALESSHEPQP